MKVLAFGTFDIFHPGHEYYLKEAKKYGNELQVVIARDATVKRVKGKYPVNSEGDRLNIIRSLDYVDKVVLGDKKDVYTVIVKLEPDVICLGYDQKAFTDNLKEKLIQKGLNPRIVRLEGFKPEVYKSSKLMDDKN